MQLCHTVTIDRHNGVTHAVQPCALVVGEHVLRKPVAMSFSSHAFAALIAHDCAKPSQNLIADVQCSLTLLVVDEMEQRPLLLAVAPSRAIFILGEIIDGIVEALSSLDFFVRVLAPDESHAGLRIEFTARKERSLSDVMGSALCLNVALDALVCARGLQISETIVSCTHDSPDDADAVAVLTQLWKRYAF